MFKTLKTIVEIIDKEKDIVRVPPMSVCCNEIRNLCEKGYCVIEESVNVGLEKIWVISPTKKGRWRAKIKWPTREKIISIMAALIAFSTFLMGVYFFLQYFVK